MLMLPYLKNKMPNKNTQFKKGHKTNVGKHWKLSDEQKKKQIGKGKGRKAWNKDKKQIDFPQLKGGRKKGYIMSETQKVNISLSSKGKKATLEARENMRKARSGAGSSFWKDGRVLLTFLIRNCFRYRQWRSDVYTRDNYICQSCFKRGGKLEAHHYKRLSDILEENKIKTIEEALNCEELWNINNGVTLCRDCHFKTDNYGGKPNNK